MRFFVKLFAVIAIAAIAISFVGKGREWQRKEIVGGYILFRKEGDQLIELKMYLGGELVTHEYEGADFRMHYMQYHDGDLVSHQVQ
jgi:hypothetical protein